MKVQVRVGVGDVISRVVAWAQNARAIQWARRAARPTPLRLSALAALATIVALRRAASLYYYHRPTDFIQLGAMFAGPAGIGQLATSQIGYDGQFFYYMARFPGVMQGAIDLPALRYSRMLYPLLIRVLSLGQPDLMPWVMLAINVAAIAATVGLLAWVLRERGLPLWLALAPGLYCGQALATTRDLADPLAIFWVALALAALQRKRWLIVAAALGFGMLTRETTLLFALCFALPLVLGRRWRLLAIYLTIVFGPYLAWECVLYRITGVWGFHSSSQVNTFVTVPFSGMSVVSRRLVLAQYIVFICFPTVAALVLGALRLATRRWSEPFELVVAAAAVLYAVAVALQPSVHWLDQWEPTRLAAPLALLLPLLAAPAGWRALRDSAAVIALLSFSMALLT